MEELKLLQAIPILKDLGDEELTHVLQIARRVEFPRGTPIIREGEPGDTIYILAEGSVEISKSLVLKREGLESKDRDKVLTKLSAADHALFGEVALFERSKRTATVAAVTDCVLLEITKADFTRLAEEYPRIGYKITRNIAELLCSRLRKADEDTIKLTTALSIALSR
jgi:CRP/FNR family transcriptional regulator, cyclic AMP receptor protein